MTNFQIVELGIFILLVSVLAYFSLNIPMIICSAAGGLGLLVSIVGLLYKPQKSKKKK
jgi:hypothetical protein